VIDCTVQRPGSVVVCSFDSSRIPVSCSHDRHTSTNLGRFGIRRYQYTFRDGFALFDNRMLTFEDSFSDLSRRGLFIYYLLGLVAIVLVYTDTYFYGMRTLEGVGYRYENT